jgi:hypothetical protein
MQQEDKLFRNLAADPTEWPSAVSQTGESELGGKDLHHPQCSAPLGSAVFACLVDNKWLKNMNIS